MDSVAESLRLAGTTQISDEISRAVPIRMQNVLTTLYKVLGIDPATTFPDHNGRPQYLLENREPVLGLASTARSPLS
jgi:hypothetical protein